MKLVFSIMVMALIFTPTTAFGWKSISAHYAEDCNIYCQVNEKSIDNSKPLNFILLGLASIVGIGIFYQFSKTKKYETFSLRCKMCGGFTRGLKCVFCENE